MSYFIYWSKICPLLFTGVKYVTFIYWSNRGILLRDILRYFLCFKNNNQDVEIGNNKCVRYQELLRSSNLVLVTLLVYFLP